MSPEHRKISEIPNDLCPLGKTIFIGGAILNPLAWPVAVLYIHNFHKLKHDSNKKDTLENKSNKLLITASGLMIPYNLAMNGVLIYCIAHYLFQAEKIYSLYASLIFVGILTTLSVSWGLGQVYCFNRKKTKEEAKSVDSEEEKSKMDDTKERLFFLQSAIMSSGMLTCFFIPGPYLIVGAIASFCYLAPKTKKKVKELLSPQIEQITERNNVR